MIELQFEQMAEMINGKLLSSAGNQAGFSGVAIDSRTVASGELFVAIKGERNDGHQFLEQAIRRQAAGVMINSACQEIKLPNIDVPQVVVADTHQAMLTLAKRWREMVGCQVVAITGSNGKTTTKELTHALVSSVTDNVYKSPGNLNNLFGLPLALFKMPQDTKTAILELGISTPEEMPKLAEIAQPDLIAITNVGPSHLQDLSSVEQVAQAKLQLVTKSNRDIPLVINGDDRILMAEAKKVKDEFITFGFSESVDIKAEKIKDTVVGQSVVIDGHEFNLPLFGLHQVSNLLAAYAIAKTLGCDFSGVDTSKIELTTAPMRGQVEHIGTVTAIVDCYNANPDSVKAGLLALANINSSGRKIVVLGDMLELGKESEKYHEIVGRQVSDLNPDLVVFVGAESKAAKSSAVDSGMNPNSVFHYESSEKCQQEIVELITDNDLIYVKASRGVGLEVIVEELRRSFGSGRTN